MNILQPLSSNWETLCHYRCHSEGLTAGHWCAGGLYAWDETAEELMFGAAGDTLTRTVPITFPTDPADLTALCALILGHQITPSVPTVAEFLVDFSQHSAPARFANAAGIDLPPPIRIASDARSDTPAIDVSPLVFRDRIGRRSFRKIVRACSATANLLRSATLTAWDQVQSALHKKNLHLTITRDPSLIFQVGHFKADHNSCFNAGGSRHDNPSLLIRNFPNAFLAILHTPDQVLSRCLGFYNLSTIPQLPTVSNFYPRNSTESLALAFALAHYLRPRLPACPPMLAPDHLSAVHPRRNFTIAPRTHAFGPWGGVYWNNDDYCIGLVPHLPTPPAPPPPPACGLLCL